MKKLILSILGIFLAVGVCWAATNTVMPETTLKPVVGYGTSATSDSVILQNYGSKTFFVKYDETDTGNTLSAAVTFQVSYDKTNWLSAGFYDYAGTSTLQTSETLSSDGWYYFIPNPDLNAPYARVNIACTNCSATSDTKVTTYISAK